MRARVAAVFTPGAKKPRPYNNPASRTVRSSRGKCWNFAAIGTRSCARCPLRVQIYEALFWICVCVRACVCVYFYARRWYAFLPARDPPVSIDDGARWRVTQRSHTRTQRNAQTLWWCLKRLNAKTSKTQRTHTARNLHNWSHFAGPQRDCCCFIVSTRGIYIVFPAHTNTKKKQSSGATLAQFIINIVPRIFVPHTTRVCCVWVAFTPPSDLVRTYLSLTHTTKPSAYQRATAVPCNVVPARSASHNVKPHHNTTHKRHCARLGAPHRHTSKMRACCCMHYSDGGKIARRRRWL